MSTATGEKEASSITPAALKREPDRAVGALRKPPLPRRLARIFCLLLLAITTAAGVVALLGAQSYHWQAFDLRVSVAPARRGQTRLVLTPLGAVSAATHRAPVGLTVELRQLNVEKLWQLTSLRRPKAELERDFRRAARRSLTHFATCQVLLGALGGMFAPLALRRRRARAWAAAAMAGGGSVALALWAVSSSFDWRAFREPTYTGSLRQAIAILPLAKEAYSRADTLSERLRRVARNVKALYGRLDGFAGPAAEMETVRLLHISDLHNNPAAVEFVRELAERFEVQAVIDTGDLTDFGVSVETDLSRGLARLPMPYLFVAGNHDSQATVKAVRGAPNAVILEGEPVMVAGLTILGMPDPSSVRPGLGDVDTAEDVLKGAGERLLTAFQAAPERPDVVCVHNPRQAVPLIGVAPLVLCGHLHRMDLTTDQGTILCNAGTTGGAGSRYFDRDDGVPLSAAVLTFSRPPKPRLLFIDQVSLDGSLDQYSIRRSSFSVRSSPP